MSKSVIIPVLEDMPKSTRHDWSGRLSRLYTICVWAAWRKAAKRGAEIPTLDAIWGFEGFSAKVYQDKRSGEMIVTTEEPRDSKWHHMKDVKDHARGTTGNVLCGVETTGLSVELLFRDDLSRNDLKVLLHCLPLVGVYAGPFWERQDVWEVLNDNRSLRILETPRRSDQEEKLLMMAAFILRNKSVRKAVRLLEENGAFAPAERRIQGSMDFEDLLSDKMPGIPGVNSDKV